MRAPKSFSVRSPSLTSSQFRSPTQKPSPFDAHSKTNQFSVGARKIKSFPIHDTEINLTPTTHTTTFISSVHWNQVKFDPPHGNQVNSAHLHKNQANFDAYTKAKWFAVRIHTTKSIWSQSRPPTQKLSQSIPTVKTNDFPHAHKHLVNFDPHAKSQVNFRPID